MLGARPKTWRGYEVSVELRQHLASSICLYNSLHWVTESLRRVLRNPRITTVLTRMLTDSTVNANKRRRSRNEKETIRWSRHRGPDYWRDNVRAGTRVSGRTGWTRRGREKTRTHDGKSHQ